jgi:hypothetical protein
MYEDQRCRRLLACRSLLDEHQGFGVIHVAKKVKASMDRYVGIFSLLNLALGRLNSRVIVCWFWLRYRDWAALQLSGRLGL